MNPIAAQVIIPNPEIPNDNLGDSDAVFHQGRSSTIGFCYSAEIDTDVPLQSQNPRQALKQNPVQAPTQNPDPNAGIYKGIIGKYCHRIGITLVSPMVAEVSTVTGNRKRRL